jgi:antirestriction protein ArdC
MSKVYQIVQEKIIKEIEDAIQNGRTTPWRKPWKGGIPKNYVTKKPYRGINLLLLDGGNYLTFNQIQDLNKKNPEVKLKKGSKSHMVAFWKFVEKKNEDGEEESYPVFRYYRVFSAADVEGIEEEQMNFHHNPNEQAENLIQSYKSEVKIRIHKGSNRAYYTPTLDIITMPDLSQFREVEEYYSTIFHEMVHSTGHNIRLNRFTNDDQSVFGSESYSKEELVAEIGSNMILSVLGIENEKQHQNSISYLYGWLSEIKKDPKLIIYAAQHAQKAADYILEFQEVKNEELIAI